MTHRYFFNGPLKQGDKVSLDPPEEKHLKSVMRTKDGDRIEVINGKGELAFCLFGKQILIEKVDTKEPNKKVRSLTLGLTEPNILELVIEKATEIGIDEFFIFPSFKSKLKSLSPNKKERIEKILISSIKQSKRLFLPKVYYFNKKEELPSTNNYFLADFDGGVFSPSKESSNFIVGPESGFTEEEIAFFKNKLHAKGVLLSENVLRAETAAICCSYLLTL
jgi:16S rRNA (uracil1498-N3)-methyltransferase